VDFAWTEEEARDGKHHGRPSAGETIQALVEARHGDPFAVDRGLALLDQGGVVDHQHRLGPAFRHFGITPEAVAEEVRKRL
jgi:hypothetical protein